MEGFSAWFSEAAECHSECDPLVVVVEGMLLFFPDLQVFFEFEGCEVFFRLLVLWEFVGGFLGF